MTPRKKAFKNTVEKGENSPFPTAFSNLSNREIITLTTSNLSSANALNLAESRLGKCQKVEWSLDIQKPCPGGSVVVVSDS